MEPPAQNLRVVLDTNVIVSAHLNSMGLEDLVLKLALGQWLALYVSESILAEYERVLRSRRFSFDGNRVSDTLRDIHKSGTVVRPQHTLTVSPDPTDNKFLECAEAGEADFLVTGNKRHFPKAWGKTKVVNARELLELIGPQFRG